MSDRDFIPDSPFDGYSVYDPESIREDDESPLAVPAGDAARDAPGEPDSEPLVTRELDYVRRLASKRDPLTVWSGRTVRRLLATLDAVAASGASAARPAEPSERALAYATIEWAGSPASAENDRDLLRAVQAFHARAPSGPAAGPTEAEHVTAEELTRWRDRAMRALPPRSAAALRQELARPAPDRHVIDAIFREI